MAHGVNRERRSNALVALSRARIESFSLRPQSKKKPGPLTAANQGKDGTQMNTEIDSWRRPVFDDVIRRIRVRSGEYYRPEFRAPWGVSVSRNCSLFHVVRRGDCQLE